MKEIAKAFSAAGYATRVEKQIPGLHDLHRMVGLLLAETLPKDANILALGAGGGMELKELRDQCSTWYFSAIDPSSDMIELAEATLEGDLNQITFTEGYIDDAPEGPFDGAVCLLVLHFLEPEDRLRTLRELNRRLKPGAPFVVVHHSFPQTGGSRDIWMDRYAEFQIAGGLDPVQTRKGVSHMKEKLPALSPEEDEAILKDVGFEQVEMFYSAFTFRGWIAYTSKDE